MLPGNYIHEVRLVKEKPPELLLLHSVACHTLQELFIQLTPLAFRGVSMTTQSPSGSQFFSCLFVISSFPPWPRQVRLRSCAGQSIIVNQVW